VPHGCEQHGVLTLASRAPSGSVARRLHSPLHAPHAKPSPMTHRITPTLQRASHAAKRDFGPQG
jgi:hypothetical protein